MGERERGREGEREGEGGRERGREREREGGREREREKGRERGEREREREREREGGRGEREIKRVYLYLQLTALGSMAQEYRTVPSGLIHNTPVHTHIHTNRKDPGIEKYTVCFAV